MKQSCYWIKKLKNFPQHDQDRVLPEAFHVPVLLFVHLKKVFRVILGFLWLRDPALDNKIWEYIICFRITQPGQTVRQISANSLLCLFINLLLIKQEDHNFNFHSIVFVKQLYTYQHFSDFKGGKPTYKRRHWQG